LPQPEESGIDLSLELVLSMVIAIVTIQGVPRYVESILQAAVDGLCPSTPQAGVTCPAVTGTANFDANGAVLDGRR
jgi:hypothetical protein